jgi:hypothetical protein
MAVSALLPGTLLDDSRWAAARPAGPIHAWGQSLRCKDVSGAGVLMVVGMAHLTGFESATENQT